MSKTIGRNKLVQKQHTHVEAISKTPKNSIGSIEDAFDVILNDPSGGGKSNYTAAILKKLLKALKFKCVPYEEGNTSTLQETATHRHNILAELDHVIQPSDNLTDDEIKAGATKHTNERTWVMDSLHDSLLTNEQCAKLKDLSAPAKRKKTVISVSWEEGKTPLGSIDKAVEYRANIKLSVGGYSFFRKVVMAATTLLSPEKGKKQQPKGTGTKVSTTPAKDRSRQKKQKTTSHLQKKQ